MLKKANKTRELKIERNQRNILCCALIWKDH